MVILVMDHLALSEELLNRPSLKIKAIKTDPQLITFDWLIKQAAHGCANCPKTTTPGQQDYRRTDTQLDNLDRASMNSPVLGSLNQARERFHHMLAHQERVEKALAGLDEWIREVAAKGTTAFEGFIKPLANTNPYIANYGLDCLSNAVTEGRNNLIRRVRRISLGMTNFEHLRLRVLAISE